MPQGVVNDIELSSGDVAELAGIPAPTLGRWITAGVLGDEEGQGQGNHRSYTVVEALAVCYGAAWRSAGCDYAWVVAVIECIADYSEADLRVAFNAGEIMVYPLPAVPGMCWGELRRPNGKIDPIFNLEKHYERVLEKVKVLMRRPANDTGRNRLSALNGQLMK